MLQRPDKLRNAAARPERHRAPPMVLLAVLCVALFLSFLLSLDVGATGIGLAAMPRVIFGVLAAHAVHPAQESPMDRLVMLDIRLPRAVLGLLIGAALGTSGAIMQGLFRNPLADPGLIGVSAGAALMTAVIIVLGDGILAPVLSPLHGWAIPAGGLAGGLAATLILYALARSEGTTSIATVLLGGVALSAFAGAATGILVFTANDKQLRDLTFWSLGSLSGASWPQIATLIPFLLIGAASLPMLSATLNAMLLGEAAAFHMGGNVDRAKGLSLLAVASMVGASVSAAGIIGFIGVLVPHLIRLLGGPDHRLVLPGSALLGAILLLLSDTAARTAAAPAEMPVGIITAVIGAPCFFWLLLHQRGKGLPQ
jgi:iron complex transport system permease protein